MDFRFCDMLSNHFILSQETLRRLLVKRAVRYESLAQGQVQSMGVRGRQWHGNKISK